VSHVVGSLPFAVSTMHGHMNIKQLLYYVRGAPTLGAASRHNMHTMYQLFMQHLLKMGKQCLKHVDDVN
jgi:hypothetical protein